MNTASPIAYVEFGAAQWPVRLDADGRIERVRLNGAWLNCYVLSAEMLSALQSKLAEMPANTTGEPA